MVVYCSKCKTNWAHPETQVDEDGEESYDVCPVCKTDSYLMDGIAGDTFIYCLLTGTISNAITKQAVRPPEAPGKPYVRVNYRAIEAAAEIKHAQERQEIEDEALEKYMSLYDTAPEAARNAFFDKYSNNNS